MMASLLAAPISLQGLQLIWLQLLLWHLKQQKQLPVLITLKQTHGNILSTVIRVVAAPFTGYQNHKNCAGLHVCVSLITHFMSKQKIDLTTLPQ